MAADTEIEWMKLTAPELNARAEAGALVIVPVASLEQHGPHLATGVDIVCATGVALGVARKLASAGRPVVVMPCVWTGLAEHHVAFGGTVTLDFAAFSAVLKGVVRSAMRAGFKRVMLLNGHGGNAEAVAVVGGECQNEFGIAVAAGTYWHLVGDAFAPILDRQSNVMHACEAETSMMMALLPEAVRADRLPEAHGPHSTRPEGQPAAMIRRRSFKEISPSGVIGDARAASAAKGEALVETASTIIAEELTNARLWA
ncbi:creatininase family protein [Roseomonas eburnea]|uniref:Creatininase family protein n=1 Tax=Neoroseomonas eburnea TaxID=1346889 RepID=A0A9X9XEV3_9PROT|nr:creatininase family protein [Neoroseomonas eburnea]MBR0682239.1 creatininase family protein [Neoroseomonas eburnea]